MFSEQLNGRGKDDTEYFCDENSSDDQNVDDRIPSKNRGVTKHVTFVPGLALEQ